MSAYLSRTVQGQDSHATDRSKFPVAAPGAHQGWQLLSLTPSQQLQPLQEMEGNERSSSPLVRPAVAFPPTAALSASQFSCIGSTFLLGPLGTTVNSEH